MRKNLNLKYKKANIFTDVLLVVIVLLGMAIIGVIANNLLGDLNTDIQNDTEMTNTSKEISQDVTTRFPTTMDGGFLFAFVLLWAFVIISSLFIDAHPVFFIISILLLLFGYGCIMMLGNAYDDIMADPEFNTVATDFPMTHFIMSNLLTLTIIMGASVLIVLYGKNRLTG